MGLLSQTHIALLSLANGEIGRLGVSFPVVFFVFEVEEGLNLQNFLVNALQNARNELEAGILQQLLHLLPLLVALEYLLDVVLEDLEVVHELEEVVL